jgi:hypothetical protein
MAPRPINGSRAALRWEGFLLLLVVAGLVYTLWFLNIQGYLPQPYFYGSQSLFTDWTVSAYFSVNKGAYTAFQSVYPPLSFVFLKIFSIGRCYKAYDDIFASRECDWFAPVVLGAFFTLNIYLVYKSYLINDRPTAWMRTIAICFGLPSLYALERGNLIIPTFTFFILGQSRVLKSAWLKWLSMAIAINFKPYLILAIVGHLFRRRWRWFEGCAIFGLVVYLVTYALNRDGDPVQVLTNISAFSTTDPKGIFQRAIYASGYRPIVDLLHSSFPLMHFMGSRPIEIMEWALPLAINIGKLGIIVCFAGTVLKPGVVPVTRLAALGIAWVLTAEDPGGYAVLFFFYLVFMERWRGPLMITALVITYLSSISYDYIVLRISHEIILSRLTNRAVGYDLGVNVGELARPALTIIVEYALVVTSLIDIARAVLAGSADEPKGAPSLGVAGGV